MKNETFALVIFDEASQVTVPLAVMAMRVGTRFVFIGDNQQLPPVLLSRSVLDDDAGSVFGRFSFRDAVERGGRAFPRFAVGRYTQRQYHDIHAADKHQ